MRIYNLFPRLCGNIKHWFEHIKRAKDLGFDCVYINPIQKTGQSRSLYSISDYFNLNKDFIDLEDDVKELNKKANEIGIKLIIDLVINHCAYDSSLTNNHSWFCWENNRIANPFCEEDGHRIYWRDLAKYILWPSSSQNG